MPGNRNSFDYCFGSVHVIVLVSFVMLVDLLGVEGKVQGGTHALCTSPSPRATVLSSVVGYLGGEYRKEVC